jgi:RNA polymerase sigma-70 factor (ECF subfamily)
LVLAGITGVVPFRRPFLRVISSAAPAPPEPEAHAEPGPSELASFPYIYRQYWRYVARIASRLLGRDDEVEDVLQEVFLIALERLPPLSDPAAVRGWLAAVTVRRVARRLRWRRVRAALRLDDVPDDGLVSSEIGPEQRSFVTSACRTLDRLPANQRIAWTLRYVEEEPLESVAQMCGCSIATAKRWIASARSRMQEGAHE